MRPVVQQQDAVAATGIAIGLGAGADLLQQYVGGGQGIGRGPRRAGCGALAAAAADVRIDGDGVASRRDRAGRAQVEAAGAADLARARMGAQVGMEIDIARLVEGADEIGRLEQQLLYRDGIDRVGTQVTLAQVMGGDQRLACR